MTTLSSSSHGLQCTTSTRQSSKIQLVGNSPSVLRASCRLRAKFETLAFNPMIYAACFLR